MKHSFNRILTYINRLPDLNGRTIIVTGANSGIGFEICKIVAIKHGRLVMAVRDTKKGEKARDKILKLNKDTPIEIEQVDLTDFNSINRFVTRVRYLYPSFHALVLNAGVLLPEKGLTTQCGYPITSGTNLFGTVYLIKELEKLLKGTIEHKIILQGSLVSRIGKFEDFDESFLDPYKNGIYQYNMSKLGLYNMFRHFINFRKENIIYGWCEPGIAGTEILRNFPVVIKPIAKFVLGLIFNSPLQAALPAAYMVCEDYKNGACVVPNGLFHFTGLPKEVTFNDKHTYYSLPKKIIDSIYEKQAELNRGTEVVEEPKKVETPKEEIQIEEPKEEEKPQESPIEETQAEEFVEELPVEEQKDEVAEEVFNNEEVSTEETQEELNPEVEENSQEELPSEDNKEEY